MSFENIITYARIGIQEILLLYISGAKSKKDQNQLWF